MSTSRIVEEESGVITRGRHPHNGYYAGDFSGVRFQELGTVYVAPRTAPSGRASA